MKVEISFDLIMEENMDFVEGTFREADGKWQVFIFSQRDVPKPEITTGTWPSGVKGISVKFPRAENLNKEAVRQIIATQLGASELVEVQGPDSMQLR